MPTNKKAPAAQTEAKGTKPTPAKATAKPVAKAEQKPEAPVSKAKSPAKPPVS